MFNPIRWFLDRRRARQIAERAGREAALQIMRRYMESADATANADMGAIMQRMIDRPPGGEAAAPLRRLPEYELVATNVFEVRMPPRDGRCSDNDCPCPAPGTVIPRGEGFLYIDPAVVEFRREARSDAALAEKGQRLLDDFRSRGITVLHDPTAYKAILMCEQGARRRRLNLEVAAHHAHLAWRDGYVPLEATPRDDS